MWNGSKKNAPGHGENYYLVATLNDKSQILEFDLPGLTGQNSSDFIQGISRSTILLDTENWKRPPASSASMSGTDIMLSPHFGKTENGWGEDSAYSGLYLNGAPKGGVITHYLSLIHI